MASYRHLARTCVMQTIFELEFRHGAESVIEKNLANKKLEAILQEFAPRLSEKDFAFQTLDGLFTNKVGIIKIIKRFAPEWPIDKIAGIDRAILEIGVYEIAYNKDIPPVVAINEAVEIAKHFGDKNSQKFINGVLSTVMKEYDGKL